MGCFIPPLIGPGEHLFEQAASTQMLVGPFTVRPDGIKDDHAARQYIGQVVGIVRMIETTVTGKALVGGASSLSDSGLPLNRRQRRVRRPAASSPNHAELGASRPLRQIVTRPLTSQPHSFTQKTPT